MSSRILRLTDSLDMKLEVLNLKTVRKKVKAYALLGVRTRGYWKLLCVQTVGLCMSCPLNLFFCITFVEV